MSLSLRSQDCPNICAGRVVDAFHTHLSEAILVVKDQRHPGSRDVTVVLESVFYVKERVLYRMRVMGS